MQETVSILKGEWTDSDFETKIYDHLSVPSYRHSILSIHKLDDNCFWEEVKKNPPLISSVDWRHWYYNDDLFKKYVYILKSLDLPFLALPEYSNIYRPINLSSRHFERILYDRVKFAIETIKETNDTKILSIPIIPDSEENNEIFLNHISYTNNMCDIYAVHCCNDMSRYTMANTTSMISQCLNISKKDLWITKWAIPSCDCSITNMVRDDSPYSPPSTEIGAAHLRYCFSVINNMSKCRWFYSAIGKDLYNGKNPNPYDFIGSEFIVHPYSISDQFWKYYHFLGLVDNNNNIKYNILNTLQQIADIQNISDDELPIRE